MKDQHLYHNVSFMKKNSRYRPHRANENNPGNCAMFFFCYLCAFAELSQQERAKNCVLTLLFLPKSK